jgi:hypothetical protein
MTKARLFLAQVAATALVFAASRFGKADSLTAMLWLVLAAGTLAVAISHRRMQLLVSWLMTALTAGAGVSEVAAGQNIGAGISVTAAAVLGAVAFMWLRHAPTAVVASKYESRPTNPWNALDQGIDPTE